MSRDALPRAVVAALRLAHGEPVGTLTGEEWTRVFEVAARERCAGLAWLRSAETIRGNAPLPIARAWRTSVLLSEHRAQAHLDAARSTLAALDVGGVTATILKGPPLAQRLYGDVVARPVDDIDLFVRADEREAARAILTREGWRHEAGVPPWHERWQRGSGDGTLVFEVHSRLTCDSLAHLQLPAPDRTTVEVGGHSYPAAAGDVVPVYLAGHLAQHELTPLLWFLDYGVLWRSLGAAERARTVQLARRCRMSRCLEWALERVSAVERAAAGDASALAVLGYHDGVRTDVHALRRLVALAERVDDVAHLVAMWIWPRAARTRGRSPFALLVPRARKVMRRGLGVRTSYSR